MTEVLRKLYRIFFKLAALHVYLTSGILMKFLTTEGKEGRGEERQGEMKGRKQGKRERDFQKKLSSKKYSIQEIIGLT